MLPDEAQMSTKSMFLTTAVMYFCYFTYGFSSYMLPTVRLDIAELIGTDFTSVTYGSTVRSAGYAVSALLMGWLMSHQINRLLGLCVSLLISGAVMFCAPMVRSSPMYLITETLYGVTTSGIDIATNAWILETWQESANPFMQGMHSCLALGSTIAPLVAEPFLSYDEDVTHVGEDLVIHHATRIAIPYAITSSFCVLASGIILIFYFKVPYVDPKQVSESKTDQLVTTSEQQQANIRIIILGSMLLAFYESVETSTFSFLPNLQVIDLKISKSEAAFIASACSAAFSVNRFISIAVATRIKTRSMLVTSFILISVANVILVLYANTSEVMLWISVIVLGAGKSPVYPCIMSFLEERTNVTTSVCSIFMLSTSITSMIVPVVMGNMIESYPMTFVYFNIFGLTACAGIFLILHVHGGKEGGRRPASDHTEDKVLSE